MSCRLLGGPFTVARAEDGFSQLGITWWGWIPRWGLLMWAIWHERQYTGGANGTWYDSGANGLGIMTLDGLFEVASEWGYAQGGGMGWWPEKELFLNLRGGQPSSPSDPDQYGMLALEPHTLSFVKITPDYVLGFSSALWLYGNFIRLPDRWLFFKDYFVQSVPEITSTTAEATAEGPRWPWSGGRLWAGRSRTDFWLTSEENENRGAFYDSTTHQQSSPLYYIGMPSRRLLYVPEFGVFVSTHSEDDGTSSVRVWALEVAPTHFSPIVVLDGVVKIGQVVTFGVYLFGDRQDPCVGELIDWEVIGTGTLLKEQSVTDETGQATVQVLFNTTDIGSCELKASVAC